MKISQIKNAEWFLRLSLSAGFLSATADRVGMWPQKISAWGNWQSFVAYTKSLIPFLPDGLITLSAYTATGLEVIFGILLLLNFKTKWVALGSSILLLSFALAMTFSKGIKAPFDYSVFTAAAAAFALSSIMHKNEIMNKNLNL